MIEVFPDDSLLAKCLQNLLGSDNPAKDVGTMYLFDCHLIASGGYPKQFDANICSAKGPFVGVAKSAKCDGLRGSD